MPYGIGGPADKLGNKYEGLFTVKFLLKLIDEEVSSIIIEPVGEDEEGVDLWVKNRDGSRECYQCKGRNASNENWRMGDLAAKGIFSKAKKQLDADINSSYYFISPLTNTMLKDITARARNSSGDPEHYYEHQIVYEKGSNDSKIEKQFISFCEYMGLNSKDANDRAVAYNYLKRIYFIQFPDDLESRRERLKDIRHLFTGDADSIYSIMANFAVENELLGCEITASMIVEHLEKNPDVSLRRLSNDVRILPRIKVVNDEFLGSFFPINDSLIQRPEAMYIYDEIKNGISVIIHGKAGCGKSGIAFDLANKLKSEGITYLALRLDRRTPETNAEHYGKIIGFSASPVFCLDSISPDNEAVLILDQLDAVRWTTAHSSKSLAVCKEIIDEIAHLNIKREKKLSLVVICRTFDYRNDRGISNLLNAKSDKSSEIKWTEVEIGDLDDSTVANIVGSKYESMPSKLKDLLRIPNNLYIWTNIKNKDSLSAIKSTSDFVNTWWKELMKNYDSQGNDVIQLVGLKDRITNLIDKNGKLFVPNILLNDASPLVKDYLLSSGMFLASDNEIGFFHQSFYDFFSMEKMLYRLYDGNSILDILGTKENQTPLRRYHLQMLLESILASDVNKFIEIGSALLEDTGIRFIMKHAYLAVMGQANLPQKQIYAFAIKLYNDSYWKPHILDTVFYGNARFVMALVEDGRIREWISSKNECNTTLNLLRSVNTSIPDEIVSILVEFAFVTDEMDEKLYNVLCWDAADDSDLIFEFRLKMIKHNNSIMQRYLNWDSLAKEKPQRALELFKLLVFEKDSISNWNNYHIDQEDINNLKHAAQADAKHIWQEFMPFLLERTQGLHNHYDNEFRFWETEQYPDQVFGRIFIELVKAAATTLILENCERFLELCEPYFDCNSVVINEILLFIMNELPAEYSNFVVFWLADNPQKRFFEYTSENDEHLFLAKSTIEKHSKTCSGDSFAQLENAIYFFHEENELQMAKWRFQNNHDIRQAGINRMYFFPYWGEVQNYLLPSLDEARISKKTIGLIGMLNRRFADAPPSHVRKKVTGGSVGSAIGAVAEKISDKQWLRIINNKKSSKRFFERKATADYFLESSPMQFASTLEHLGDKDPNRVAKLALQFDENTDTHYINAVLSTLGKTKPSEQNKDIVDWQPVDKDIAEKLLLKFGKFSDAATEFSRAIENRANEDWGGEVLAILSEITENHPDPEPEKMNVLSSNDKESKTINSLFTNSMNCARGCAARAVARLLWENYTRYSALKNTVKSAVFDKHLAVNMAAVECILPMYNFDKDTSVNWFTSLVTKDIRLASHRSIRDLYYHLYKEYEKFVTKTILDMYYSEYDDVAEMGAKYIANFYLLYGCFEEIIFSETQKTASQIKGILFISVELLKYSQHYEKAKRIIEYYLEYVDKESNFMLPRILDRDIVDIDSDFDFIVKVVSSKQSRLMMHYFIDFIEESDVSLIAFADIIFAVCDSLVKYAKGEVYDPSSELYGVTEPLSKLITSLYEQSKDRPELVEVNQECLNMWDLMFEYRIGTIRELSQSIMEQ
jgi:hypothetical protein